jgi:membrane protein YdbS with pleckstrin-like domain
MNQISAILSSNERIFWEGRPLFRVFIAGYAFIGFIFSLLIVGLRALELIGDPSFSRDIMIVHWIVVLMTLGIITYGLLDYRARHYAITDKRLIFQNGIIGRDFQIVDFDQVANAEVNVDLIDKIFGGNATGTITIAVKGNAGGAIHTYRLQNIRDPYETFKFIKQVTHDVKTDIQYPNALRPKENPGYKTQYQPPEQH